MEAISEILNFSRSRCYEIEKKTVESISDFIFGKSIVLTENGKEGDK